MSGACERPDVLVLSAISVGKGPLWALFLLNPTWREPLWFPTAAEVAAEQRRTTSGDTFAGTRSRLRLDPGTIGRAHLSRSRGRLVKEDVVATDVQQPDEPQLGSAVPIPADDLDRQLVVVDPDSDNVRHISLAGDTYSMVVTGEQTNGRYCLIDMHVPAGGGPPLHRHNFEEMFTILDGTVDFFFRGMTTTVKAGSTVNIPANAPHHFRNNSGAAVRMLCICAPAGQDEYFIRCGDAVDGRTSAPPDLSEDEIAERRKRAGALAAEYATEMLPDDGR